MGIPDFPSYWLCKLGQVHLCFLSLFPHWKNGHDNNCSAYFWKLLLEKKRETIPKLGKTISIKEASFGRGSSVFHHGVRKDGDGYSAGVDFFQT